MKSVLIESTNFTPTVVLKNNGQFLLEGVMNPENAESFFEGMITFVAQLSTPKVKITVNLGYINSLSSKKLLEFFRRLESNLKVREITVNWHYQEEDYVSYELAEIYEACFSRAKMNYFMHTVPVQFQPARLSELFVVSAS